MAPTGNKGRGRTWKPEYLAALRHIFSEMWRELGYADNRVQVDTIVKEGTMSMIDGSGLYVGCMD